MKFYESPRLRDALRAEGYELPEECAGVELTMPVDGIMQLKLVVNLTGKSLGQLANALQVIARETQDDVPVAQFDHGFIPAEERANEMLEEHK
jgi:hypothetical protein